MTQQLKIRLATQSVNWVENGSGGASFYYRLSNPNFSRPENYLSEWKFIRCGVDFFFCGYFGVLF